MPAVFEGVDTEAELRDAIFSLSNDFVAGTDNGPYTINITGNITLTQSLPMIRALLPAASSPATAGRASRPTAAAARVSAARSSLPMAAP